MTKRRRQVLIWGSVAVGAAGVTAALLLGATAADVLLGVGTTIGLAALVFWLEQHWEQRVGEIEQRTEEKINEASRAINERIDDVLVRTSQSATSFVAAQSTADREMLDQYLSNPTSDGYLDLLYRLVELGIPRPPVAMRFPTSKDVPVGTPNVQDGRLGNIAFQPDREIRAGKREARAVTVSVSQPIQGGTITPKPPDPVHVVWESGMSVSDLMGALLAAKLPSRAHLWVGPEQFAIVLTEAVQQAGWTVYNLIAEQLAGRPAAEQSDRGQY